MGTHLGGSWRVLGRCVVLKGFLGFLGALRGSWRSWGALGGLWGLWRVNGKVVGWLGLLVAPGRPGASGSPGGLLGGEGDWLGPLAALRVPGVLLGAFRGLGGSLGCCWALCGPWWGSGTFSKVLGVDQGAGRVRGKGQGAANLSTSSGVGSSGCSRATQGWEGSRSPGQAVEVSGGQWWGGRVLYVRLLTGGCTKLQRLEIIPPVGTWQPRGGYRIITILHSHIKRGDASLMKRTKSINSKSVFQSNTVTSATNPSFNPTSSIPSRKSNMQLKMEIIEKDVDSLTNKLEKEYFIKKKCNILMKMSKLEKEEKRVDEPLDCHHQSDLNILPLKTPVIDEEQTCFKKVGFLETTSNIPFSCIFSLNLVLMSHHHVEKKALATKKNKKNHEQISPKIKMIFGVINKLMRKNFSNKELESRTKTTAAIIIGITTFQWRSNKSCKRMKKKGERDFLEGQERTKEQIGGPEK
ncbi:hypothetical protein VP01_1726g3 [Puccinia sorghi]|uniref:Uncharacterized protein n=1 Tax=Puccinia sorghi TaxID=27349 RepID=A0A0L6VFA5_9BASI|nr:hypothetical protein VP01_1726g3 [Puccinia sorghi]